MSTIQNLYQFIDKKGISINEFSKKIGVSNGYFAKQKTANGAVSSNIIEKIVREFPELDTNWLFTGKGEMYRRTEMNTIEEDVEALKADMKAIKDHLDKKKTIKKKALQSQNQSQ